RIDDAKREGQTVSALALRQPSLQADTDGPTGGSAGSVPERVADGRDGEPVLDGVSSHVVSRPEGRLEREPTSCEQDVQGLEGGRRGSAVEVGEGVTRAREGAVVILCDAARALAPQA